MNITKFEKINETLYHYVHPTGVNVFMVSKPGFAKFSASFSTHFGSIDNTFVPIGKNEMIRVPDGVAHFLEHKVFEQEDGTVIFEEFGKNGASANAYTSFNLTNYYFWATSNYEKNIETLIKFVQAPYFTKENVEKEKGIIGQEIGMYDDNPSWRCYFNLLQALYHVHPVRLDIAGTVETISEITEDTLYTCYNTFYHPSNMFICVVGDFEPEKIAEVIDKSLKPLSPEKEIPRKYPVEPYGAKEHKVVQNLPVSIPMFCAGFKDNGIADEENIAKRCAAVTIGMKILFGSSSDCDNDLYNEKLIASHLSADYTAEDRSYAFAEISGESENPEEVGRRILKAANSLDFTEEDFKCVQNTLYGGAIASLDDSEGYMQNLSRNVTLGFDMFENIKALLEVTPDDVRRICGEIFREENYCISIIKNK